MVNKQCTWLITYYLIWNFLHIKSKVSPWTCCLFHIHSKHCLEDKKLGEGKIQSGKANPCPDVLFCQYSWFYIYIVYCHIVCCFDSYKIILCSVGYFKMSWGISLREKIKIKWVVKRYRWPERQKQYKDDSNVELWNLLTQHVYFHIQTGPKEHLLVMRDLLDSKTKSFIWSSG